MLLVRPKAPVGLHLSPPLLDEFAAGEFPIQCSLTKDS